MARNTKEVNMALTERRRFANETWPRLVSFDFYDTDVVEENDVPDSATFFEVFGDLENSPSREAIRIPRDASRWYDCLRRRRTSKKGPRRRVRGRATIRS